MATILELNSDCSDSEEDCDYVPDEGEISEESPADSEGEDEIVPGDTKKTKRKRQKKTATSKDKETEEEEESDDIGKPKLSEEEEKRRADELFKKFLEDDEPVTNKTATKSLDVSKNNSSADSNNKVTVTEEYEFAGETVKVTKEVDASSASVTKPVTTLELEESKPLDLKPAVGSTLKRSGGLSSIMGVLSKKKQKLSTLEKSKLDWSSFKREEGIEEELEHHNKGRGGFLERQAFLQRTDLRQFEIEKSLRLKRRSKP